MPKNGRARLPKSGNAPTEELIFRCPHAALRLRMRRAVGRNDPARQFQGVAKRSNSRTRFPSQIFSGRSGASPYQVWACHVQPTLGLEDEDDDEYEDEAALRVLALGAESR